MFAFFINQGYVVLHTVIFLLIILFERVILELEACEVSIAGAETEACTSMFLEDATGVGEVGADSSDFALWSGIFEAILASEGCLYFSGEGNGAIFSSFDESGIGGAWEPRRAPEGFGFAAGLSRGDSNEGYIIVPFFDLSFMGEPAGDDGMSSTDRRTYL